MYDSLMSSEYPDTVAVDDVPQSNTLVTRTSGHIVAIRMEPYDLMWCVCGGGGGGRH